ncbi:DNA adenine methylase [Bacillus niacini]|uniref:Site-specific DNA-methyltransferase (adenine-specific) n=1 Tax=Neobacillus niacini TaxID=86668 RepID=A0A852TKX5_9BACI|nr:Dam family site-specific DNA-(adenine-N6)-methyltransferase [Neobacillus niacini]NYE08821.1 DNA adenine methylase [Neobacillus niacini]
MTKLKLKAKPFLKWAGGKTQLLPVIHERIPNEVKSGNIKYYVEPFVGSGAVFIDLLQTEGYRFEKAYIWDVNPELINVYNIIKSKSVSLLIEILKEKDAEFNGTEDKNVRKHIYSSTRDKFNKELELIDNETTSKDFYVERAAEFIFLNRTCFNGLYRVNKAGKFNVPMGDYKHPKICDEENLLAVHELLEKVEINLGDYRESQAVIGDIIESGEKVFVYFDPPYRPLNVSSSFNSYSKFDFNDESQTELAAYFKELDELGASLMLSNSDPHNTDETDDFFDDLYEENLHGRRNNISRIPARRNINSKGDKRGHINELLITNY